MLAVAACKHSRHFHQIPTSKGTIAEDCAVAAAETHLSVGHLPISKACRISYVYRKHADILQGGKACSAYIWASSNASTPACLVHSDTLLTVCLVM